MATCRDCVGYNFCSRNRDGLTDYYGENSACDNVENLCCTFQNKSDFQEVKHGYWCNVYMSSPSSFVGTCSECQRTNDIPPPEQAHYCTSCGAKMDGGKSE